MIAPNKEEKYILMKPNSSIGESCLLRMDFNEDGSFSLTSVAFKGKYDKEWERVNIKSNVVFKTISEMICTIQPTHEMIYLTKEEAFVEIL